MFCTIPFLIYIFVMYKAGIMKATATKQDTNLAAIIHLSTFSKYFIPLGNFIFPLIIWATRKHDAFIDAHGKQAINFQISIFLYMVFVGFAGLASLILIGMSMGLGEQFIIRDDYILEDISKSIPILVTLVVVGILLVGLFILELFCVITATVRASEGALYRYPLTIPFLRSSFKTETAADLENSEEPTKQGS